MRPLPRRRRRVKILTWNAKVGRNGETVLRAVRNMARWHRPWVICLQEARGYRDELARLRGYELQAPTGPTGEDGNCVTLVRLPVKNPRLRRVWRVLRLRRGWRGPKRGLPHAGRRFLETRLSWITVVNLHRTRPGWSDGGRAFAEEYEALLDSCERRSTPAWVCVGDQNIGTNPADKRMRWSPWQLHVRIGGRVITTLARHIDYAVGVGVTGKAKRLAKHGSDHNAVLITLRQD